MRTKTPFKIKENSWIARLAAKKLGYDNMAIVLGDTIHLFNRSEQQLLHEPEWLRHELCHVQQFRRYGFLRFIGMYLWESLRHGYSMNKYEMEARACETPDK